MGFYHGFYRGFRLKFSHHPIEMPYARNHNLTSILDGKPVNPSLNIVQQTSCTNERVACR